MCKNCKMQTDKATLKAQTDRGPLTKPMLEDKSALNNEESPSHAVAFPYRSSLSFEDFRQKVEASYGVWAFWHTAGSIVNNPSFFKMGKLRKLILIAPNNPELEGLPAIFDVPIDTIKQQIFDATKFAKQNSCEVRWWLGHITNSVTIGNPTREDTWCEIEALLPSVDANSRAKMEFRRPNNTKKCNELESWFLHVWSDRLCQDAQE